MTDIFLSYSSKDRALVRPLVEVLESHGWSVWWDQEIPTGTNFGKVIEKNLSAARCAIVVWTRNSVDSDWVRNEASEAHSRGALIPILLEKGVKFPLEFRQVETRDLSDWQPGADHAQFDRLFADLQTRLSAAAPATADASASSAATAAAPAQTRLSRARLWRTATSSWWYALTLLALPALFVGALAWALMRWHMPSTNVELDLSVRRLRVQFGAHSPIVPIIKDALALRSLAVRNFARVEFEPKCLSVLDAGAAAGAADCTETGSSTAALISAKNKQASLLLEPHSATAKVLLQPLEAAAGASVSFESDPKQARFLTLKIDNPAALSTNVYAADLLRLSVRGAQLDAATSAAQTADFKLNVRTGNPSQLVTITGGQRAFTLRLEPEASAPLALLSANGARIATLDIGRQAEGEQGEEISALVEAGELRYADLPADNKIALTPQTLLKLAELREFSLTQLRYDPAKGAYALQARGKAQRLATFVGNARTDRRLSWFDRLWNDPKLRVLFTIITFVLGATPGLLQLLAQTRRT